MHMRTIYVQSRRAGAAIGVRRMKRWYAMLVAATLAAALGGMLLSFTMDSAPQARTELSHALVLASLAGFVAAVALRPARGKAEAVGAARGAVKDEARATCDFSHVAANAHALQSLAELRDYLINPAKYARYGARMPKGVLLYGPPGTGKTLLARALAGEAKVPFFALSGSDFVEKYVGVGAGRVRELFKKARKAGKCVIFIDEIDALGKRRDDNASDERDQTLNALLSEMSGFYTGDGVIVVAATNRIDALDPALLRPGRFDRQIEVGLPGRAERLSILKLHSENKPLADDVSLEALAAQTVSFSGASLETLLNEAALIAAARNGAQIEKSDLQTAFYKTVAGADRPITATEYEKRIIAVHEAGHALASRALAPENKLTRVSILPAGHGAAGYNLCVPAERVMLGKRHIEAQICVLLAGRAAEQAVFGAGELTAGASTDIARATELAASMVSELGMDGEPAVSLKALSRACGGVTGAQERCRAILDGLYRRTLQLIEREREALTALSDALMEAESLEGEAVTALLDSHLSSERPESA